MVLKPKGSTWRTQSSEGGGCLYDYAAHPLNLVNWYFGAPQGVGGSILNKIFSRDIHNTKELVDRYWPATGVAEAAAESAR